MLCFFNFFLSNSSSSIHFFLSASIRMPFIWLVIFCLFSLKQKAEKSKAKKQKQNKTVYRLCSYRLVICFIGSAIAHGAQKAADIVLTYVFMQKCLLFSLCIYRYITLLGIKSLLASTTLLHLCATFIIFISCFICKSVNR